MTDGHTLSSNQPAGTVSQLARHNSTGAGKRGSIGEGLAHDWPGQCRKG